MVQMEKIIFAILMFFCGVETTIITIRLLKWSVYMDLKIEKAYLRILKEEDKWDELKK